ncbi:MAG: DNA mismatch repair endonuclease MutL [Bacteroidota bacterium]|nr:DNA mismatch repair endonuclease MutL [Bacteroidota bacterium]MDP4231931.1 DNA mismatch repair endonuclease MutL [Bacteroidota bacterium]MDP4241362.1 DNA mismatch repair endonuclease MutL [Bacteroidota bacterium]MDP4287285.1 DNA mismatch repair endonuclease MutL [Bacteroidota bacterium]
MPIVKRLPESIAQKIAAGEVVTRPESVVKELLENALDAKAQNITIVLKDAGRTLIQVIDDGSGMTREDARTSIERHATSKLWAMEDLESLSTYGFRGEALAAIASVSQFEMRTRTRSEELGTLVEVEGSILRKCESIACDEGTSVSVRNIFFNIPARRKFMKSEATEFKHVVDTVTKAALSATHVHFIFVSDGDLIFDLPGFRPLPERIEQIFGPRLRGALLPVESVSPALHVVGFTSAPSFVKRVRSEQFFFINNRPVTSRSLSYAVASSYEHLIDKGAFPSTFLSIEIDPSRIDVNVHPQKLEVKFEDERSVTDEVRRALQEALTRANTHSASEGAMAPEMTMPETLNSGESNARMRFPEYASNPAKNGSAESGPISIPESSNGLGTLERLFGSKPDDLFRGKSVPTMPTFGAPPVATTRVPIERISLASEVLRDKPVLWQLHNKYIFSQIKSGLMIVDQHVAHERILYERALRSLEDNHPNSQQLLFPQHLDLLPRELAIVRDLQPELEKIGFQIRFFGGTSIIIDGIPADVHAGREESILRETLDGYDENGDTRSQPTRDKLAATFACKAAIKAGDKLSQDEMHVLIEQLFETQMPYVCPHGRPIVIKLAIDELDRRFGRSPVENLAKTEAAS